MNRHKTRTLVVNTHYSILMDKLNLGMLENTTKSFSFETRFIQVERNKKTTKQNKTKPTHSLSTLKRFLHYPDKISGSPLFVSLLIRFKHFLAHKHSHEEA